MNKLIIPAIAIVAVGGYLYYANLDNGAPVAADETIASEVDAAVAEAEATGVAVSNKAEDMMASAEGDVFADVPEAMDEGVESAEEAAEEVAEDVSDTVEDFAEESADTVEDAAEATMDEVADALEEIDHADE